MKTLTDMLLNSLSERRRRRQNYTCRQGFGHIQRTISTPIPLPIGPSLTLIDNSVVDFLVLTAMHHGQTNVSWAQSSKVQMNTTRPFSKLRPRLQRTWSVNGVNKRGGNGDSEQRKLLPLRGFGGMGNVGRWKIMRCGIDGMGGP